MSDYDRVKVEAEKTRNAYLEFIKAHPKTVAVILAAVVGVAIFAAIS